MKLAEVRMLMEQRWMDIHNDWVSSKHAPGAVLAIADYYNTLDNSQKLMANHVIAEWVTSSDPAKRFDALALADQFNIRSALPRLRALEATLQKVSGPEARDDLIWVRNIISRLAT